MQLEIRIMNTYKLYTRRIFMATEPEPIREPTDHRCEHCGKVFAKAEDLSYHYDMEHVE